jgi:hypothetical protein
MKNLFHKIKSKIIGKNTVNTPTAVIADQLLERRPLPMGMTEFEEWSDRIISGALCQAEHDSQKFALAEMIMHLGPTEDFKEDAYFIHYLRKSACNQIAHAKLMEIKNASIAKAAAKVLENKSKTDAATSTAETGAIDDPSPQEKKAQ